MFYPTYCKHVETGTLVLASLIETTNDSLDAILDIIFLTVCMHPCFGSVYLYNAFFFSLI